MVLVHGGPGAAGEMAALARELCDACGVLEPFQNRSTVQGQVDELKAILESRARKPAILVGFSWGAWLCFILAARHPELVKKLILVGSGPFESQYAEKITNTRMARLTETEREELKRLSKDLADSEPSGKPAMFAGIGRLLSGADAFDPVDQEEEIDYRPDIFEKVWPEAAAMRRSGKLLDLAALVKCPVCAIHGDYDPHPADGVKIPLGKKLKQFRFVLLEKCGHKPWTERKSRMNLLILYMKK